ncbi:metal-dependent hydrolase [[Eubacterium] cellulosolvens]
MGISVVLATRGHDILGEDGTRTMRLGVVWGSILPDVDLLISIVIIAAGGNMQQALAPHRTLTHSLFTILALAVIGLALWKTDVNRNVGGGVFGIAAGMLIHVLFDLRYEVGVSVLWPLTAERFGLFWALPGIWAYLDQTLDFLFAAIFFYALHALARKYLTPERLLIPSALASVIAFLGMVAYDLTGPSGDQWLLVYAIVGLPFLILILLLPWVNRRILYSIPTMRK